MGGSNDLRKAAEEIDVKKVGSYLQKEGTELEWHWNPPYGSHMGGVWERLIRSVRSILNGLLNQHGHLLDDEGLATLMCEVEAIINSRPLTTDTLSDPKSVIPLSPSQLLTQKFKVEMGPPGSFDKADLYCRRGWRRVQHLANEFWNRWQKQYLNSLQKRQKWTSTQPNLQKDDIVMLKDDSKARNSWPLGKVVQTLPDKNGLVRQVNVLASLNDDKGPAVYRRPISKLVLLVKSSSDQ